MSAMWLYLKENVKCGTKLSDVLIGAPERCRNRKGMSSEEECLDLGSQLVHPLATPIREFIFRQNYSQTRLYEMEIGDPSRKIVGIIFQKASMNPSRPESSRIKTIQRVKNSIQMLERFEKFRGKVRATEYDRYTKHPRGLVDGNEPLNLWNDNGLPKSKVKTKI